MNKLVIDEEEAEIVRMMFNLCVASGFGRWRLAMFLNDKGIKNRRGQNWHDATVGAILHNVIYKGGIIIDILHSVFDRLTAADENVIIGGVAQKYQAELKATIKSVKSENARANTEYESLKAEVIKAVQGKSKMPVEVLLEMVDESRNKVIETSEKLTSLMAELEEDNENVKVLKSELAKIHTWSQIFDKSDLDTRKMIANYMIKRITVYKSYKLDVEFNIHIQHSLNGLENGESQRAAS